MNPVKLILLQAISISRPDMCGEFGKDFRPKFMSDSDDEPPTSDPAVST
jgi:hypothetical protein